MPSLRTCPNGHRFNKTSDCPTCPQCEADRAPKKGWMSAFGAPARRALEHAGISTVQQLAKRTQQEILALHGMGPASLPNLLSALKAEGLSFTSSSPKAMKQANTAQTDTTEDYLKALPKDQRDALQQLRKQILAAVPGTEEHFGYGMPAFKYNGHPMLYIGAAKNHCALYGSVPAGFKQALKDFTVSKGAIQFTPEKPIPAAVVKEIARAKAAEIEVCWPVKKAAKPTGSAQAKKTSTKKIATRK